MPKKRNDALAIILTEDPPPPQPKAWVCIRRHYNNVRMINVGETVTAMEAPGKHWQEYEPGKPDVIGKLRTMLNEMEVQWSADWDIARLTFETERSEEWKRQKEMRDKYRKETGSRL